MTDGRRDKRFCDDACRLRHHRKLLVPHPVLHEVDRTLQRNRSLLKRARTESLDMRPAEEAFRWLRKQGFDFNFHTHISTLPDGRLAVMCYEEGYVVEEAGVRRNLAQSEVGAARARVASARQQLDRTEVRAPFDGVVASRKVSAGDTATMGKELVQVIDPASLRYEGLVPADRVAELRVGQAVKLRIQGQETADREGRIRRIDAVAQPVSRQVAVVVDLGGAARSGLIAGLYAEGLVEAPKAQVLALPETALVRDGERTVVWRLEGDTLQRRVVQLAPRDARTGLFTVTQGLQAGDRVLRSPGSRVVDGQRYTLRGA